MGNNTTPHREIEEFWKMFEGVQIVQSTNSVTGEVEKYPDAIIDMEETIAINGEFDKGDIDKWLEQLIKSTEERVRGEILKDMREKMKLWHGRGTEMVIDYEKRNPQHTP